MLRPMEDRLAVRPMKPEEKMGSLYIPAVAQEDQQQGEVLAVGLGKMTDAGTRIPVDLVVGEVVLFGKYSGSTVEYEGEEILIIRASDVLAVL